MDLAKIFEDKNVKPKERTEAISRLLIDSRISVNELIIFAKKSKDPIKATCIEALEFGTRNNPAIATDECLEFVSEALNEKAPRVKWESAKVIGNIAHLFPDKLDPAIKNLLNNTEHSGTVVRWSAAFALTQIIRTKSRRTEEIIPTIKVVCEREAKNSIKKIYLEALKTIWGF